MKRAIARDYTLDKRDVREAIVAWIKSKGLPTPGYLDNTPSTSWEDLPDGSVKIRWSEDDDVE